MAEKIFLRFLILCGIWSQGIIGTFADEENKESSDFLVRQKRVVSYVQGEDISVTILDAPYVVRIKELSRNKCVGTIVSINVVITSTPCVSLDPVNYQVISNSAYIKNGHTHNVREIKRRTDDPHHTQRRDLDGVALVIIIYQFGFTATCQPIRLHIGQVLVGATGKVHGWGYNFRSQSHGTNIHNSLRSIEVPIISRQNCVNSYRDHLQLSEKIVCTYHPQRHSGHIDFGAGLIVDGTLAGVFLWSGLYSKTDPHYPEVFAYLQDDYYKDWIRSNLESIDLHVHH